MDENTVETVIAGLASVGLHAEVICDEPVIMNISTAAQPDAEMHYLFTATLTVTP